MKSLFKCLFRAISISFLAASLIFSPVTAFSQGLDPAGTITTYNVTLTSADTEYSQALPKYAKFIYVQCRTAYAVRVAFATGKVATPTAPYSTIKANGALAIEATQLSSSTIYLASSEAGVVVEIIVGN